MGSEFKDITIVLKIENPLNKGELSGGDNLIPEKLCYCHSV